MAHRTKLGTVDSTVAEDTHMQNHAATSAGRTSTKRKRKSTPDWSHVEQPGVFNGEFHIYPINPPKGPAGKRRRVDVVSFLQRSDEQSPDQFQPSPFENTSVGDNFYRVEPSKIWSGLSKYKRFTPAKRLD